VAVGRTALAGHVARWAVGCGPKAGPGAVVSFSILENQKYIKSILRKWLNLLKIIENRI
jgi:hypothetical protein